MHSPAQGPAYWSSAEVGRALPAKREGGSQQSRRVCCRNWTRGVVLRRGQDSEAGGAVSFQRSAISFWKSVVSCQLSVNALPLPCGGEGRGEGAAPGTRFALTLSLSQRERGRHAAPRPLAPSPWPLNPIAALRPRSAAFELEFEIRAMTKTPIKQAPNATGLSAGKVQLQR
jgi:hypothetical protein